MARIRVAPEDFVVDELPLYPASVSGAHTFVRIEKRDVTTERVARALARAAGVAPGDVGYAGRKDRRAVARQWLSVPGLEPERALGLELPGARVLEAVRHPHKLRTGHLRANAFALVVRDVDAAAAAAAGERLETLCRVGLANRFGPQRYGRDGANAARGRAVLEGRERPRDRRAARFLVSALQAAVFDEALARRPLALDAVEPGEVAQVVASGGLFVVESAEREGPRAAAFEISATGPIFALDAGGAGLGRPEPSGAPALRERAALDALGIGGGLAPPRGLRVPGARRPLRVPVTEASAAHAGDALALRFVLPPGSYATVLVEALLGDVDDPGEAASDDAAGSRGLA